MNIDNQITVGDDLLRILIILAIESLLLDWVSWRRFIADPRGFIYYLSTDKASIRELKKPLGD